MTYSDGMSSSNPTVIPRQQHNGQMTHVQVVADPCGRAAQVLMAAARVSGIPHAFVVDAGGIVRYHGHPAAPDFEQAVKKVPAQQYHKLTPSQAAACMLSHFIS